MAAGLSCAFERCAGVMVWEVGDVIFRTGGVGEMGPVTLQVGLEGATDNAEST